MHRRTFVKNSALTAFGMAAFGSISWNGKNFEGDTPTTSDILGPFYRPGAPMRSNLIPPGAKAEALHLKGILYNEDGKTPLANALIESWQCDEHELYDNVSDDYLLRGAVRTGSDGKYAFTTIVPVPYKDGEDWRPAHIHLRISSRQHQDLITQIYCKGDPHIVGDASAESPQSANRILEIKKNAAGQNTIQFNVVMAKNLQLNDAGYRKITGLYKLNSGTAEFTREDDLLMMKINGQIMEGMVYSGNNRFEGGMGFNKVSFQILPNGEVQTSIRLWDMLSAKGKSFLEEYSGTKLMKYSR